MFAGLFGGLFFTCNLARISHRFPAAATLCRTLPGLHSVSALDIVSTMPAHPPNIACRFGKQCSEWSKNQAAHDLSPPRYGNR